MVANFAALIETPSIVELVSPCTVRNPVKTVKDIPTIHTEVFLKKSESLSNLIFFERLEITEKTTVNINIGKMMFAMISVIPEERSATEG